MEIVVGGSMKFRDKIMDVIDELNSMGIVANCPNTSRNDPLDDKTSTKEEKLRLALDHYKAIEKADGVYFVNPGGYMGTSCKIELGYALACKKLIYFSDRTNDIGLDCYVTKFIPLDKLSDFKTIEIS